MQGPLISLPTSRTHSHDFSIFCSFKSVHRQVFFNLEFSLCKVSTCTENFWWSKLKQFPKNPALHLNKRKEMSCNLWGFLLSPFLNNPFSSEKAGQEGAGWLWMGLHHTAPAGVVGFEGFSCQTPLSTRLRQYVTGFGLFRVVRNSKWPSPCLTPEEKTQEHICSNHHLAFSIWTIQNPYPC